MKAKLLYLTIGLLVGIGLIACGEDETSIGPEPNRSPNVTITSPADSSVFHPRSVILFEGSAIDSEDGPLADQYLTWVSSIDGFIGEGTSFTSSLAQGQHTVTLTASDLEGAIDSASVYIVVKLPIVQNSQ